MRNLVSSVIRRISRPGLSFTRACGNRAVTFTRADGMCDCMRALHLSLFTGLSVTIATDRARLAPDGVKARRCSCGLWLAFIPALDMRPVAALDRLARGARL